MLYDAKLHKFAHITSFCTRFPGYGAVKRVERIAYRHFCRTISVLNVHQDGILLQNGFYWPIILPVSPNLDNFGFVIAKLQVMKHLIMAAASLLAASAAEAQMRYPATAKVDVVDDYFGTKVADPYRWLENDTSEATAKWVEEENALTSAYLKKIPFRDAILKRYKEIVNYEKIGMPFEENGKWYIYRNNGLQNQSVLYQMNRPGGEQRVWLDPNALSNDGTVALKDISFSNNGKYMAYVISRSGSDWEEIYVKDVATGRDLPDHILWAKFTGVTWQGDGFYYSAYDAPEKGKETSSKNEVNKVYYHRMGTPQTDDRLFYQNPSYPLRFYGVSTDEDERVMFLYESGMAAGNNLYVRDLRQSDSQFVQMTSQPDYSYSTVDVLGDSIIVLTNAGAPRYRLMVANLKRPGYNDWTELVPETSDVLESAQVIGGKLILKYTRDNCSHIYVHSLDGKRLAEVELPSVGTAYVSGKRKRGECFYSFTSYTVPTTIYNYDLASGKSTLYAAPKIKIDLSKYESKMVFYTSKDGTRAPLFITYKKGIKLNGKNPLLLYGYGGFNVSYPPAFSTGYLPFLERGGIYVNAVLRGGGEYGEDWHLAGTKMQKQNVFDDFIAAAEYLIANKYTDRDHLAIKGGSNGGLLVGACLTQRPDLYKVCIADVGVMDMLRYHKFTIGWNWAPDYGTSADSPEMFRYLLGYSPLHTLKPGTHYPATLVTTADHDDRVVPAHSFKFAARLQECQAGDAPTLIRIDSKAGHGGGKPLAKVLEEQADTYSFILYNMGVRK